MSLNLKAEIKIRSAELKLPATIDLTHLTPGESVGFDSMVNIHYAPGVEGPSRQQPDLLRWTRAIGRTVFRPRPVVRSSSP